MTMRRLLVPLVLIGGGIFALVVLQWKLDLGEFAESPQLLEVPWPQRLRLAGGRGRSSAAAGRGSTSINWKATPRP